MQISLAGKRLIITGSSQGLGETIARAALAAGAEAVTVTGRDGAKLAAVARALGPRAHPVTADLALPDAPAQLFDAALAAMGRVDALVNAAALTTRASMLDGTVELWNRLFSVNTRAPYMLMQALIRHLRDSGAPGSVVNILSINAHCGEPGLAIYAATKGALLTLTKNAAHAHVADRIRVNGINMGWVATPGEHQMQATTLGNGPDWERQAAASLPLNRLLTMDEVANLTLYLLSDASGLQTGTVTDLDQRVFGANG
jgi:NAD(P)-dependent dehydrogenase (short-subunit alcohol dehydrogenase family)